MSEKSEPVFVLAVWNVCERSWCAFLRCEDRSKIDLVKGQLDSLVMVFTLIVEVARDDDDAVVSALAMLPKVHPEAVFRSYFDLAAHISATMDRFEIVEMPESVPKATLN